MELKDVILSTLAEMEDEKPSQTDSKQINEFKPEKEPEVVNIKEEISEIVEEETNANGEILFLTSMRERLLVLFEGFQAPNNTNIEAKVDMTLNFLEYVLVTIDSRLKELEKGHSE